MTEKQTRTMETFKRIIPQMDDDNVDRLYYYGEGLAFGMERRREKEEQEHAEAAVPAT